MTSLKDKPPAGLQTIEGFQVKLSEPPVPPETYSADVALVKSGGDDVTLWFFQLGMGGKPYSAVKLCYGLESFLASIERDREFFGLVNEWVRQHRPRRSPVAVPFEEWALERPETLSERVSFERIVQTAGVVELEFFFVSPALVADAERKVAGHPKPSLVRPVACVSISSGAFVDAFARAFLDKEFEEGLRSSLGG